MLAPSRPVVAPSGHVGQDTGYQDFCMGHHDDIVGGMLVRIVEIEVIEGHDIAPRLLALMCACVLHRAAAAKSRPQGREPAQREPTTRELARSSGARPGAGAAGPKAS